MRTRLQQSSGDPVSRTEQVGHRSVLLQEAIGSLAIARNDIVVDATLGGAGHARELARLLGPEGVFVGFDLDADAIMRTREALKGAAAHMHLVEANFRDLASELKKRGIGRITKVLFDLGWSSYQLDSGRGFSISGDEPLLMTYPKGQQSLTAAQAVNEWSEESLADVIYGFGGERFARRIARVIVARREQKPFTTARELADVIKASVPGAYAHGRIHPATRTFQALRIAVNDELGALEQGLRSAYEMLAPGGRIAVITFHSLEDRIVKRYFAELERSGMGKRVNKKAIAASAEELRDNRRARSAKLRVWQKNSAYDKETSQDKPLSALHTSGDF